MGNQQLAVCVKSCHRDMDAGLHQAIRDAWGRDLKNRGASLFFFMGEDPTQNETRRSRRYVNGEIVLERCPDNYDGLPVKTRRICQWLQGKMYQNIFLCDCDTYVNAERLLKTEWQAYDYYGDFFDSVPGTAPRRFTDSRGAVHENCRAWASGGFGYFLSRRAAEVVAGTPPSFWAEDMYVGNVLAPFIDSKELTAASVRLKLTRITEHWSGINVPYTPKIVREAYVNGGFRELFVKGMYAP
jgi:Galactosyltransferase